MIPRLIVAPQAESDLRLIFDWYESRAPRLGHTFMEAVERRLAFIHAAPHVFRRRFESYRLASIERFPYAIYFIWDEVRGIITIRRILHFKQDQRSRLGDSER